MARRVAVNIAKLPELVLGPGSATFFYAFPSAANSRNKRAAIQIALVATSCAAFSPRSSHYHHCVFNRIRSFDGRSLKCSRRFLPDERIGHGASPQKAISLFEAAPGVHPAKARRIAVNIAELPGLDDLATPFPQAYRTTDLTPRRVMS